MRIITLFLVLTLFCLSSFAQSEATLSGTVRDNSGKPLQYARLATPDLMPVRGSITDADGRYSLTIPVDTNSTGRGTEQTNSTNIRLVISHLGYEPIDTILTLQSGEREIDFALRIYAKTLDIVTVTDEKTRSTAFTSIAVERIEQSAGPQEGVEGILKTLPDVSSNNEMTSQYSVRGGSFDENLVYINGVEIYRPLLVRNGQQEGSSIINGDMVDFILFSPGGFDASYGDRMASVLDITYGQREKFSGKASASLLGGSISLRGNLGEKVHYSAGLRQHSNRYLFRTLDTKGNYTTSYSDFQGLLTWNINEKTDLQLLTLLSRNIYGLIPETQTTTFGGWQEAMEFSVFYEGEESDRYLTMLGALSVDWHPNDDTRLRWTTSFQSNDESEAYDILSQFWLYELNVGAINESGETERFDRGVGSFLEHARNHLSTEIISTNIRGTHNVSLGKWVWGMKMQYERVDDRMREWKWVDSAGFAIPSGAIVPGVATDPEAPILQQFCNSRHRVETRRMAGFVQRNVDLYTRRGGLYSLVAGARVQWYSISLGAEQMLFSPRLSLNYKPKIEEDILLRLAAGVYSQAPFYREYRRDDGTLNSEIRGQRSYQVMGTFDWNLRIGEKPFKFTADLYYKYIDNLIPYRIDNLRIRYDAHNEAIGYATGLSIRLSGELVEGLESWASFSVMKTEQDIEGDGYGWIERPTDQRLSLKLFIQDNIPAIPFWRMSLGLIVGSGLPFTYPTQKDFSERHNYPTYLRIDWGNTLQLSRFPVIERSALMRHVDDILLTLDIFNLFDYRNVVSYIWVADYSNQYYPVPNYLTSRQLNVKLTVLF